MPDFFKSMMGGGGGSSSGAGNSQDPPPPFPPPEASKPQLTQPAFQSAPAPPPAFSTRFACVTLNQMDRIRFISFGTDDVAAMRGIIQNTWPRGIDSSRPYGGADELKLNGYPWRSDSRGGDDSRRLVKVLLGGLFDRGWVLQAAVDMSKKDVDKDSLIFRYQSPPPPPCEWLAIAFYGRDRLRFIDRPPPDLATAVISALGKSVSSHEMTETRLEIKFNGTPWWPSGENTVATRVMVLRLLEVLEAFGFSLYTSLDHQTSSEGYEADLLIVHRQKDWIPGAPVFHR